MVIEIGLIQNFLFALIIVAGLAAVLFVIVSVINKNHTLLKPHESNEHPQTEGNEIQEGYKGILKHANKHARLLLEETAAAASEMLIGTKITNEKIEENMDHVLQGIAAKDIHSMKEITEKYEKEYNDKLQKMNEELSRITNQIAQDTQKNYNEKLEKFTNDLLKNGLATQDVIDKKTAEMLSVTESEIEAYKKAQMEKVEDQVKKLIEKVYRDILQVSIPQNVHQELIIKSLEDAKKDGLFKL